MVQYLILPILFLLTKPASEVFARLIFLLYIVYPCLIMFVLELDSSLSPQLFYPLCYFSLMFLTLLYIFYYVYSQVIVPYGKPTVYYYWLGNFFSYNPVDGLKWVDKKDIARPPVNRLPKDLFAKASSILESRKITVTPPRKPKGKRPNGPSSL